MYSKPLRWTFMGNEKNLYSSNSCNFSYLIRLGQDHQKKCSSRFLLHKSVYYLKLFWTHLENVHLQGPCNLRPCTSRPYCILSILILIAIFKPLATKVQEPYLSINSVESSLKRTDSFATNKVPLLLYSSMLSALNTMWVLLAKYVNCKSPVIFWILNTGPVFKS